MDVDGLPYEGLVELTERVGSATRSDGSAFVSLSVEELEDNSSKIPMASYLLTISGTLEEDDDVHRCPICLGNYDASRTTMTIQVPTSFSFSLSRNLASQ